MQTNPATSREVTYRALIHARVAPYVVPLLDKIVADDEDGDTLRDALIPWRKAQRPPIAIYRGDVSTCRIDGPWQVANSRWLPLGGLILTSGMTAHLDPFEADALHKLMQKAVEETIAAWVRKHGPYDLRHVPDQIDRAVADPAAKAMIAAWAFGRCETDAVSSERPEQPGDCCSGEPATALCAACREGLGHA